MISYGPLAQWYDALTGTIPYEDFIAFYKKAFSQHEGEFSLLLDLCCGTGTLTYMLASLGYDMIGTDASPDMLSEAMLKSAEYEEMPLFLCQSAEELDLYGTVDAAVSSLDSINYISPELFPEVLRRLHLFVRPGGLFIFDIRSENWLRSLDGSTSVNEEDNVLALWRADFAEEEQLIEYNMDIFTKSGRLWKRSSETHVEYVYTEEFIRSSLEKAGFVNIEITANCPQGREGRRFITAQRDMA